MDGLIITIECFAGTAEKKKSFKNRFKIGVELANLRLVFENGNFSMHIEILKQVVILLKYLARE